MYNNIEEQIKEYIEGVELIYNINEAVNFILNHQKSQQKNQLKSDVENGTDIIINLLNRIQSGENKFKEVYEQNSFEIENRTKKNQIEKWNHEDVQIYEKWANISILILLFEVYNFVNKIYKIDYDLANKVVSCFLKAQVEFSPITLFLIACKIAKTNPTESYQLTTDIFKAYPDLSKRIGLPLEQYIYQETEEQYNEICPICGSKGEPFYSSMSCMMADYNEKFSPVKLWLKCQKCNNLFAYNFPKSMLKSEDDLVVIMPEDEDLVPLEMPNYLPVWSSILNEIRNYTKGANLLEIGIGTGELIAVALEMNYSVDAIEIVKQLSQRIANGLRKEIICCDFLNYETDKKYNVIIMGDVIEHVSKPCEALKKAYDMLDDSGVLWISTPNYESSFSRMRKFEDPMWNEPFHYTYFSYNGLKEIVENIGFKVQKYSVSGRYNGSMELILTK